MPDTERGTYSIHLPRELCDGLAVRAGVLPRHIMITQRDVISQRGVLALRVMWLCAPEVKEILEESCILEAQLVKDCMAAVDLEQKAFVSRIRELLREYAAVRVERKRHLAW